MTEAAETESSPAPAHPLREAEHPSVAVIIPCWNAEKWVARAIQSVLDQDYPNLEVIVIDDGSTDNSLDVIRSFGDRIRWETGPNRGAPAARNRGLALTEAEYVMFLDADDWLARGSVGRLVARSMELSSDAKVIVFGKVISTDVEGRPLHDGDNPWVSDGEIASEVWIMLDGPRITAPLHRRTYLLVVGGFTEGLPRAQEYDLHVKLMNSGVSFLHNATPVFFARQHNSPHRISNTRAQERYWKSGDSANDCEYVCKWALQRGMELTAQERKMIAYYAWTGGRALLRSGEPGSDTLLELARSVSPHDYIVGSRGYRTACRILGPALAEQCVMAKNYFAIGR